MKTLLLLLLSINAIAVDFVDVEKALNDGNTAVAEQWLKQIDENSSDYNKVDFIKARLALSNNELDDEEAAIAYLTKEINNNLSVLDYVYYRGYLYSGMEKYDNAIADYSKVVDDKSEENISSSVRLSALYQLGRLASIEKKWLQKGRQCYLEFLNFDDIKNAPKKSWATYRLGLIYQHLKQDDLAQQSFNKAMAMNPPSNLKKRLKKVL